MKCRLVLLLCLAVSVAAFSETISAKSYYVSPSGSGSQCTLASPCSVTTGLAKPSAGDEVVFLDGTYKQTVYVKKGGSSTAHVVVRALNRHKAVVRVTNGPLARVWANYVTIRGIVFDGGKTGGNKGAFRIGAGEETSLPGPVHHVIVEDVVVRNTRAAGIIITSGEHDIIIRNSRIESTGHYEFWGEAFYLGSKYYSNQTVYNLEIYRNEVVGFTENGLEAKKFSRNFDIHDNIFRNQVLWADYGGDKSEGNDGTITLDGHSHKFYNNVLHSNKSGMGVFVLEPEANHRVYNNIIYNGVAPASSAIRMKDWSKTWSKGQHPPTLVYNNTFYNLPNHDVAKVNSSILVIKNNLGINCDGNLPKSKTVASLFKNCSAGDFRLVAGSAAIDQARSAPYSPVDFDGRPTSGSCRDLGAFEYFTGVDSLLLAPTRLRVVSIQE